MEKMRISSVLNSTGDSGGPDQNDDASATTTSVDPGRRRRNTTGSLKYTREQGYFIWYHRVDLQMGWHEVVDAFNNYFGQQRDKNGLQTKFYRVLSLEDVDRVRIQAREQDIKTLSNHTRLRFAWMR
ncbi:uncharacterized protein A1O5_13049 [Cladophialophora psammophila CBS 110553]|uniref:Uncharacterized protein n=1 Tax=Cladophialophora psammophila CBS 110553 TaxID=1182543 RepID=W9W549_9EURO|nr:uncharacterized protein A1O5_13049 [Cladophialophora psammophila CBS 110553]EXJ53694.1 hypothetical protein A1O5_13049 [Cladophialophora psammophila CBS 110553]